jgi:hypothetical protein
VSLAELETSRKRTLLASRVLYSLAGVLFLLGLGGRGWAFLLGVLLALFARLLIKAFQVKVKEALVVPLAEAMGFRYSPERGFSKEEALASGLFPIPDAHASEDLVEGEVNGIPFTSSDIALYKKTEVTVNNTKTYHYEELFRGALYRFHLPFSVEGEVRFGPRGRRIKVVHKLAFFVGTFIIVVGYFMITVAILFADVSIPDILLFGAAWTFAAILVFASTLRIKKGFEGLERVVLESPEFERFFDAYGDQVEARKLLTPRVQEALVHLREYFGRPVWGAVRGRDLWLAIEGKDRFSVPINRPVNEIFEIEKERYQEELSEVYRVVEALRLEEEAKRKGVWWRKLFTGSSESSSVTEKENAASDEPPSVPKKESGTLEGDQPRQTEGTPKEGHKLFAFLPDSRKVKDVPGEPGDF